jgi:aminoglycoside phosphotransferase family enzyme
MSLVFLTQTHAWKLKKPVRTEFLDFSTPAKRRRNCEREVRLNRRLAPDVYRGVVPLTVDSQGNLQLSGSGPPIDWLVCMRRLQSDRMLDQLIARHAVSPEDVSRLAAVLAGFYRKVAPIRITGPQYRNRLAAHFETVRKELTKTEYGLSTEAVTSVVDSRLDFLRQEAALFDARVEAGVTGRADAGLQRHIDPGLNYTS